MLSVINSCRFPSPETGLILVGILPARAFGSASSFLAQLHSLVSMRAPCRALYAAHAGFSDCHEDVAKR